MSTCGECGFDGEAYTDQDVAGTLRNLGGMWGMLLGARGADPLPPEVVSALVTTADATSEALRRLGGPDTGGPGCGVGEITARGACLATLGAARADLDPLLHTAMHELSAAGRVLPLPPAAYGSVAQVNRSGGGVPKRPVSGPVTVGPHGLDGDRQASRQHHGRPWQALCVWSAEVIGDLQSEGHPIAFGSTGENITLTGLPWSNVSPGVRIQIGTALVETTAYAIPCVHNARWFVGRDFNRMHHETHPGSSRIYARVLRNGTVEVGDPVVLEPARGVVDAGAEAG